MKAILIDDEEHCITTLLWSLKEYCSDVDVVATAQNGADGIFLINHHKPNIVFLDIEMPIMNGIDMLNEMGKIEFDVIFVTAYDRYAVNAIRLNALDYLLKPVDKDELINAVNRVRQKQVFTTKKQIEVLIESRKNKIPDRIALSTQSGLQFIKLTDIMRIESEGNYCYFFLSDKRKILISKKLGDVENTLIDNDMFFRAHKSHIINLKYVERYVRGDGGEIIMNDAATITLSRNKKEEFLERFSRI